VSTIEELKRGDLKGVKELKISSDLDEFPREILELSDTLELLDLSNNRLDSLPDDIGRLKRLKILFLGQNRFTSIPRVLSTLPSLTMIGLKSNQISMWEEDALPLTIRWIVFTDNSIEKIPLSIGKLINLQKMMLAGNSIKELPSSMRNCKNLELMRLSANRLIEMPDWVFDMPKLSWLAYASNPCSRSVDQDSRLDQVSWRDIDMDELLGEGASGIISRVKVAGKYHALKLFRGDMTSDGYPQDELLASMRVGDHPNLNRPHSRVVDHPQDSQALLFDLIPSTYTNLSNPPSLDSCTRDIYDSQQLFDMPFILEVVSGISSALMSLHDRDINHGDLYAHNILVDSSGHSIIGDFGASTIYDRKRYPKFQRLEVRAFGYLLEELIARSNISNKDEIEILDILTKLKDSCIETDTTKRPTFREIYHTISTLSR